jgi:hypothetical protein
MPFEGAQAVWHLLVQVCGYIARNGDRCAGISHGMVTGVERGEQYGAQSSHNQRNTLKEDRTDAAELSPVRPRISFEGAV